MKKLTKDNEGITLIILIITVIVMLILVSVVTYTGLDTYKQTKVSKFVIQMQLIQKKVDELTEEKQIEELITLGESASSKIATLNQAYTNNEVSSNDINSYRYFSKATLLKEFDLEDIDDEVLINFITKEVVSINGIEYNGNKYFTQYNLPSGQKIIQHSDINRNLDFNLNTTIDGLNAAITISEITIVNGTLRYQEENENYSTTITNYSEIGKEYTINLSKSGTYIFSLTDNTTENQSISKNITIKLTNKPKLDGNMQFVNNTYNYAEDSTKWAYAQDTTNSDYYLWIPRFAYKTDENTNVTDIKFLKGNSNVATDNTYIDETWLIHKSFTAKSTGIWVYVPNLDTHQFDMIQLLDTIMIGNSA